jgi:hypothetical protein
MSKAKGFLAAMALVPATGLIVVLLKPPPTMECWPYQILLLMLAVAALLLSRATAMGAVWLYCATALLPVGGMIRWYEGYDGGFNPLVAVPLLGIVLVAQLTRDERATLAYGVLAGCAAGWYGALCNDWGQAGLFAFASGAVAGWQIWALDARRAREKLETCYRGLKPFQELIDERDG